MGSPTVLERAKRYCGWLQRIVLAGAIWAVLVVAGSLPNPAEAYRFLIFGPDSTIVTSSSRPPFVTWDPMLWPPGEAVEVGIVEDPTWSSGTLGRLERLTEDALGYWSGVDTADLKFAVRRVSPDIYEEAEEGLFVVVKDEGASTRARGAVWARARDRRAVLLGCRVTIPDRYLSATHLGTAYLVYVLIHEFGHCLGLHHSAVYPDTRFREQVSEVQLGLDPVMSYGVNPTRRFEVTYGIGDLDLITPDDEVGISLLWPRAGWTEATGSLWGAVLRDDGMPVRSAAVLARRLENGQPAPFGVNAFTDPFGSFSIDGLEPGSYLVKVYPVLIPEAHPGLLAEATREFPETTVIGAVEVRAGSRSVPLTIHVRAPEN